MTAKAAILQALVVGPGYGLQLIQRVRWRSNGGVLLQQGSIYPALRALQCAGLVCTCAEPAALKRTAGRPRILYQLTPEGEQLAQQQRRIAAALFRVSTVEF